MSTALAAKPMSHTAPALPDVKLLRLEIAVRWSRPYEIPAPVVSNVLRGALGITLRRLVCPPEWLDNPCAPCPLYEACAYGRVFMPTPPPDATQLRLQQDLPRPFVIEPHCHENGTGSDQDDRCLSHFR
ncbi:MAG: hypothetical protein KY476_12440, partial [Planctomycetes bacterium]|nr:hypothetical protein [Planctomycetota bacterium]